jgi:hypothetical protein
MSQQFRHLVMITLPALCVSASHSATAKTPATHESRPNGLIQSLTLGKTEYISSQPASVVKRRKWSTWCIAFGFPPKLCPPNTWLGGYCAWLDSIDEQTLGPRDANGDCIEPSPLPEFYFLR